MAGARGREIAGRSPADRSGLCAGRSEQADSARGLTTKEKLPAGCRQPVAGGPEPQCEIRIGSGQPAYGRRLQAGRFSFVVNRPGEKVSPIANSIENSYTLAIEGATYDGSVAIIRGSEVIAERTISAQDGSPSRAGRGEKLMPAIAACLDETRVERGEIARIVCGSGPGSFTSLRVAGSLAKGLSAGLGIPLYAVSSLLLTVTGAKPPAPNGEYLSVLDAMRGEFYSAHIIVTGEEMALQTDAPRIINAEELHELANMDSHLTVIGPGQQLDAHPHARGVATILESLLRSGPVDLGAWEPDYGRLAEAQVKWEAAHGRPLTA